MLHFWYYIELVIVAVLFYAAIELGLGMTSILAKVLRLPEKRYGPLFDFEKPIKRRRIEVAVWIAAIYLLLVAMSLIMGERFVSPGG